MHPRTAARLREFGLGDRLGGVRLLDPLGYIEFLGLMADARLVITDSGGIQEETTVLGVPCLTVRRNTERPVTLTDGTNQLVEPARDPLIEAVTEVLDGPRGPGRLPELWDGRAADRIASILLDRI